MKTDDQTLIEALLILASDIQCEDGVAVACIVEAANRLRELTRDDMVLVPRDFQKVYIETDAFDNLEGHLHDIYQNLETYINWSIKTYKQEK